MSASEAADFLHRPRLTRSSSLKLPSAAFLQAKYLTLQKDLSTNAMESFNQDEKFSEEDSNSDASELDYENVVFLRKKVDEDLIVEKTKRNSIRSIGSMVTVGDVDALFGSFNRFSSFFITQHVATAVSPSNGTACTPISEESVLATTWFFDIIKQQNTENNSKNAKALGAKSCESFISYTGPVQAISFRTLLMDVKPRTAILSKKVFYVFKEANNNPKCKEKIAMADVIGLDINRPTGKKVTKDLFGFAIKVAISTGDAPIYDTIFDKKCSKSKAVRQTYLYAVQSEELQNAWMVKLLESITKRFPANEITSYLHACQCYAKYKLNSPCKKGWIVLTCQRRLVHCFDGGTARILDLRKMLQIQLTKHDAIKRSIILMECSQQQFYIIMDSEADTYKWYGLIKSFELSSRNESLEEQQLNSENVPIVVEKCLRYIYSFGSMTEDVHSVPGNKAKVKKLLESFRADAFPINLTYGQHDEHDVASAIQKFLLDMPSTVIGSLSASFMCVSDINTADEKRPAYRELLSRLSCVEYQTLRAIIDHLNSLHLLKHYNKMSARKLAKIWGKHLLTDLRDESEELFQKEHNVVHDLIMDYKELFSNNKSTESQTEKIIDDTTEQLHISIDDKSSDDFKVWIKILPNEQSISKKHQLIPITLTPTKTVIDVCYELIFEIRLPPESMTMTEVILNGELKRPMHPNEVVLDTVLRWKAWSQVDSENNCLVVVPSKFFNHIEVLSNMKTHYDVEYKCLQQSGTQKKLSLELTENKIQLFDKQWTEVVSLPVGVMHAYLNSNKNLSSWGVTLVKNGIEERSSHTAIVSHLLSVSHSEDQVMLFVSIAKRFHQFQNHYETSEI